MDCNYCEIARKEFQNIHTVYEDKEIIAVVLPQTTQGHILIIPKEHVSVSLKVNEEIYTKAFFVAQKLSSKLLKETDYTSFNIVSNTGIDQVVPHASLHIIPRQEKDDLGLSWQPKTVSDDDLNEAMGKLRGEGVDAGNSGKKIESGEEGAKKTTDKETAKEVAEREKKNKESSAAYKKHIRRIP